MSQATLFVSRHCQHWRRWLHSLPCGPFEPATIINADSSGLTMQAAADGAGVCIVVCELVHNLVRQQRLVSVFDRPLQADAAFWLVYSPAFAQDHRLHHLRRWLTTQLLSQTETQSDCTT